MLPLRHSTSEAGRPLECCAGVAAQTTAAQTVWVVNFYSITKTKQHCDTCSHDEPPCWNVPGWQRHWDGSVHRNSDRIIGQHDVTITSGSWIDGVIITHMFSFEIVSGATSNGRYDFRSSEVTRRFEMQMNRGIFQWWILPESLNSRLLFRVFQVSWQKDSAEPWIGW